MAKDQRPIEIFMPPNMLKAKVGGTAAGLDMGALKRAEQAMTELKTEFSGWINADVEKLVARRDTFARNSTKEARDHLYRAGLDLKGQALTFEFPLAARVAASLCRLLDTDRVAVSLPLVDAHVGAIRVIVRDGVKNATEGTAAILAAELEARVAEALEA
jgi:hypothetical protein